MSKVQNKWENHIKKNNVKLIEELKLGFASIYDEQLINDLRNLYLGEIPGSIIMMLPKYCSGLCFDRSLLIAAAINNDRCKLVKATTKSLRLNPLLINRRNNGDVEAFTHYYIEYTDEFDNEWIYDSSYMLKFTKSSYIDLEEPKIKEIITIEEYQNYKLYKDILNNSVINQDYQLTQLEISLDETFQGQLYLPFIKKELELLSNKIKHKH